MGSQHLIGLIRFLNNLGFWMSIGSIYFGIIGIPVFSASEEIWWWSDEELEPGIFEIWYSYITGENGAADYLRVQKAFRNPNMMLIFTDPREALGNFSEIIKTIGIFLTTKTGIIFYSTFVMVWAILSLLLVISGRVLLVKFFDEPTHSPATSGQARNERRNRPSRGIGRGPKNVKKN